MKRTIGWLLTAAAMLFLPSVFLDYSLRADDKQRRAEMVHSDDTITNPSYRSPSGRHKIELRDEELVRHVLEEGGRVIADYGSYKLLEVNSDIAREIGNDDKVEFRDEYNLIMLNAGELDTTDEKLAEAKPQGLNFSGKRLHLVQFAGPVRPEWFDELVDAGVQVISYIPNNAYLVYGDRRSLRRVQRLTDRKTNVQWDGEYRDDFKIDPGVFARDEKGAASLQLQSANDLFGIQLVEDKEANPGTLALIDQVKFETLVQWEVLSYLNLVVRMSADRVKDISGRPDVVSIAPYVMPQKFDERQDQIIAGNLTGNSPTPGDYLAYLASQGFTQAQFTASTFAVNVSDSGIDNATTSPGHFGLYTEGNTSNPSRIIYNRLEGTPHAGSTLQGCDGHGTLNSHIIGGFVPTGSPFNTFPHADSAGFRYGLGVCPFVRMGSSVIFDPNIFTSPNLVNLESKAYQDGARISSNSWGANVAGAYNLNSQTFDAIVRDAQPASSTFPAPGNQEYVVVFAAGNAGAGAQTVGAPATAKNVITAGASENVHSHSTANGGNSATGNDGCNVPDTGADNANDIIAFSSRGPCADQRKKPELVAPGTHVTGGVFQINNPPANGQAGACFNSGGVCALLGSGTIGDPDNFFPLGQQFYTTSSGTSHSTPAIAGAAALVRQHLVNQGLLAPSPAMTKAALMNSARYLTGVGANDTRWSNSQGMGEVNLSSFFDIFATPSILRDQVIGDTFTASGQMRVVTGNISDPTKPFRVTLVWTDPPGPTVGNAFINNLDLEVTVGGSTFKGNVFSGAFSVPGGASDPRNNAESVIIPAGVTGTFIITIKATNIAGDGVPNFGGPLDQDFALVVYNAVEAEVAVVTGDNAAITAEGCSPANGAVDPNEMVSVDFALRNIGTGNTTNLVATLLSGGGVTAPSGPQSYGALIAGGPAVSRSFTFTANSLCGGTVTATLQLQDGAADLGTATFSFTVGTLNPLSVTADYSSGGLAVPITDLSTIESPIVVTDTGIVSDVNVRLRINHTFDGDLDILLVAPDGTTVELTTDNGGAGDNFGAGATDCTGDFTVFDDSAASSIVGSAAPFVGAFRPERLLSALNGKSITGTWKLRVTDDANLDNGTLFCWELEISRQNFICCGVPGTPFPVAAGSLLVTESCVPPNFAPDPDETVSVSFALNNAGSGDTTNLVATLLATGGVNTPSGPQTYGVVPAGGPAVSRTFSFVPRGPCGGTVTASLQLQDGAVNLGTVSFTLVLGTSVTGGGTFSNPGSINIPAGAPASTSGPAGPYPSTIAVSGLTGPVSKVTVTLSGMNHTFPDDIDILLVGPAGQKMILMSDAGGSLDLINVNLTFDDDAASPLPDSTQIVSGTFRPTNFGTGDTFVAPAPGPPYGSALSVFNGTDPNGTWSLFVTDDAGADVGSIAGGWSLTITTSVPVCCDSLCTLTCPADITQSNDAGQCSAVVNFGTTVVGTCGVVVCSPPSGSTFPVGTTTVNCTATRADGATNTCSFTVSVVDNEAPVITGASVDQPVLSPPNHRMVPVTVNYSTTDNCTPTSAITCSLSVTSNEPVDGTGDGDTSPDWEIVDAHNVRLRAERAGTSNDRIYTITITCTDGAGNAGTKTVTVKVLHDDGT